MSEEPLSPIQAASALREVAAWSDQLEQRTVGLTWMLWGIVTPAIFLTYAWADEVIASAPWLGLLWLPWGALGLAFTALLWRSARVERDAPAVSLREIAVHAALFLLASAGAAVVTLTLGFPLAPPTAVLLGIGLLTAMLGVREIFGRDSRSGVGQTVAGVLLLVFAVTEGMTGATPGQAALANAIASAVVLSGYGAYRYAWRG